MKIYQVGGAVRDKLLGLGIKDRDWVVVGATPEAMLDLGFQQVGRDFPVFLHPHSKEEYALARTERKSGKGYTGFVVHASPDVTLEQDLLRRDLTINAIAMAEDGSLVDPYHGQADIEARLLRHVSPAFAEDPLRVLRVARFAARFHHLGFSVAPETLQLMQAITKAGELQHLVPERVWQEWHAALQTQSPQVFFSVLREAHALDILFPELARLFGVPQPQHFHPEIDTGVHTLMVLEQAAQLTPDPLVRFAALVHDLGKGCTPPALWPAHKGHEEEGTRLIEELSLRLRIPNDYRNLGKLVSLCHTRCHKALKHDAEELLVTLEKTDALRRDERFELFLLACEADARGRLGLESRPYPQRARLQEALHAARRIDIPALARQYREPQELAAAIRAARVQAIAAHFALP
ncbi:MAG: multifunctional CCA addition/repair protein [Pseudohongiellaceae bacterium]